MEILDHRNVAGVRRVLVDLPDGQRAWMPACWTDAEPLDPFLTASGMRSSYRVEDLLRLVRLIAEVQT